MGIISQEYIYQVKNGTRYRNPLYKSKLFPFLRSHPNFDTDEKNIVCVFWVYKKSILNMVVQKIKSWAIL